MDIVDSCNLFQHAPVETLENKNKHETSELGNCIPLLLEVGDIHSLALILMIELALVIF
jgi:hypothetical protein